MMKRFVLGIIMAGCFLLSVGQSFAEVDWAFKRELDLKSTPLDTAISPDGQNVFVLLRGEVLIYPMTGGEATDRIPVDGDFDRLKSSPRQNLLVLSGKSNKVKVIQYDFRKEIDISGSPVIGKPDAPVTIVAFDDYQCPYCAKMEPTFDKVLGKYPKDVKLVIKNFPLSFHKYAKTAAAYALAADRQGKYEEFHAKLFENYRSLSDAKVEEIAKELGLDFERLKKDMADPAIEKQISKDMADGKKAGVKGTPTVFINGRKLKNRSVKGIANMVKSALKKKRAN